MIFRSLTKDSPEICNARKFLMLARRTKQEYEIHRDWLDQAAVWYWAYPIAKRRMEAARDRARMYRQLAREALIDEETNAKEFDNVFIGRVGAYSLRGRSYRTWQEYTDFVQNATEGDTWRK